MNRLQKHAKRLLAALLCAAAVFSMGCLPTSAADTMLQQVDALCEEILARQKTPQPAGSPVVAGATTRTAEAVTRAEVLLPGGETQTLSLSGEVPAYTVARGAPVTVRVYSTEPVLGFNSGNGLVGDCNTRYAYENGMTEFYVIPKGTVGDATNIYIEGQPLFTLRVGGAPVASTLYDTVELCGGAKRVFAVVSPANTGLSVVSANGAAVTIDAGPAGPYYSSDGLKLTYFVVRPMQNGYVPVTGLYATVDGQAYWLSNTVNMVPEAGMNYAYESQVVDLCNKERVAAGLLPLLWANELADTAHLRAREIREVFSHTRPNGEDCFTAFPDVPGATTFGENIAAGFRDPASVMQGWMNSPGHRANILDPDFLEIAVGCYTVNGYSYWVQNFAG